MGEPSSKRSKPALLSIGTHNGTFHCDEALGCFLLRLTPLFKDANIVRTRDPQAIDAVDNGVNQYNTDKLPKYVDNTRLSGRVGRLNPDWMEVNTPQKENECFEKAMELAGQEFLDCLRYHIRSWLPARTIVSSCISKRKELEPSGQIMMLDRYCPWKEHIHELENELKVEPSIKYVLYQDERSLHWRIQAVAVAVAVGRFESRRPLPASWRGLVNKELSEAAGVKDCVFVHSSGFIGGNLSFEGALKMGVKALEMD